jgi:FHS family L-fucose permease-like MFS transporter
MAIIGGAILPLVGGGVADLSNLNMAFVVPMIGYVLLTVFAVACARSRGREADVVAQPAPH